MKKNDAVINNLKIENYSETEKSLIASSPIKAGDEIMFVPLHQIMRYEKYTFILDHIPEKLNDHYNSILALYYI